jgi:YVTN family beta-propeller protein
VGRRPWGIAASPDGRWVVTANGLADTISLIDAKTLAVVRTISVGKRPWGVVVIP